MVKIMKAYVHEVICINAWPKDVKKQKTKERLKYLVMGHGHWDFKSIIHTYECNIIWQELVFIRKRN